MPLKLAGLLVTSGAVPSIKIDDALRRQVLAGGTFDTALFECGVSIAESTLLAALEGASGLPAADGAELSTADRAAAQLLPGKLAERHCLLPLRQEGRTLLVAVSYPANMQMLEEIGFLLGRDLAPHVAVEARLREAISRAYQVPLPARHAALLALLGPVEHPAPVEEPAPLQPAESPTAPENAQAQSAEPLPAPEAAQAQTAESPTAPEAAQAQSAEPLPAQEAAKAQTAESPTAPEATQAQTAAEDSGSAPEAEHLPSEPQKPEEFGAVPEPMQPPAGEPGTAPQTAQEQAQQPEAPQASTDSHADQIESAATSSPPPPAAQESFSFEDAAPPPAAEADFSAATEEPLEIPDLKLERDADEGLASALERVIADAEKNPELLRPRRNAPRDRVDVAGLAQRIVAASGGTPALDAQPAKDWTLGIAKAELAEAQDRHQVISIALHFALKTFDFAAAFAVVGGNAVGWTAVSAAGKCDEKIERISLPLDAPSVLRTVLLTRGRYLGPIPDDAISRTLVRDLDRADPTVAFLYPVEVRERPVVILYGDTIGRPASDKRVAEFVAFAQHLGPRFERLIVDQKRRLSNQPPLESSTLLLPSPQAARSEAPPGFALQPPSLTTAELFARSPPRRLPRPEQSTPAMPSLAVAPAPGVSRVAAARAGKFASAPQLPSMNELFGAADRLVGTDLSDRARALGELCRFPEVGAAVLVARFPGPLLRARVPVNELPAAEDLGPVPAALAKMGLPAARALVPLVDHRDLDTRYFALLTAGRLPTGPLLDPVAARVFDRHPVLASAARAALTAMRGAAGWDEAMAKVRSGLEARETETAMAAARALGQLREPSAVEKLISLTGSPHKKLAQVAADALRDICSQSFGPHPIRWSAWWSSHREGSRPEWLIEALGHRDLELRAAAIDELQRALGDNLGFVADGPRAERDQAVRRWVRWWQEQGRNQPPAL